MKLFIALMILTSTAFAAETTTECPMMKHQGRGINPKVNMEMSKQIKTELKSNVTTKQ